MKTENIFLGGKMSRRRDKRNKEREEKNEKDEKKVSKGFEK